MTPKNREADVPHTRKFRVWLLYDLGFKSDRESLFSWLDERHAIECGDGLSCFFISAGSIAELEQSVEDMTQDLKAHVEFGQADRVYLLGPKARIDIADSTKFVGKFIVGGRKEAPWNGYAQQVVVADEAEEE